MKKYFRNAFSTVPAAAIISCFLYTGCSSNPASAPTASPLAATAFTAPTNTAAPNPTKTKTATPIPFPELTLQKGENYFSLDGQPAFLLSRNPTGKDQTDFNAAMDWARQGGSKIIRVHLTHGWWGDPWINKDWSVNEKWAQNWDRLFNQAQMDGIYVIPVFGVWADWNNGKPDWGSPFWQYNPLNTANGGPVESPGELFVPDSDVQRRWLGWVRTLVKRWEGRENIAAWEIFSEIDIATGAAGHMQAQGGVDEATGVDFTEKAQGVIHGADSQHRPVTLSVAGVYSSIGKWTNYYNLVPLDFIEVHAYGDTLDRDLIGQIRKHLTKYQKPVLIGECGLWSMVHKPNAETGIRHAIWAGLVSGAMNGRALWDHDGYSIYAAGSRADAETFMQSYAATERPVADFTRGVDFSGFGPLASTFSSGVWGAAIGSDKLVIGWYRDASSEPPNWNLRPVVSKQTVTFTVPGTAADWKIDFYDTKTGTKIVSSATVTLKGGKLVITLPDFTDDIAFKLHASS